MKQAIEVNRSDRCGPKEACTGSPCPAQPTCARPPPPGRVPCSSCYALIRGQLQLPSPRGAHFVQRCEGAPSATQPAAPRGTATASSLDTGLPGLSWPSPHMGQKCSLQNGRAVAAPIPRHQTYCSPGVLVLLRSRCLSIFTPCPSWALGMLAGERKRPYSLGRGSSISKPRTSSQLCRRCFTRQCLSFPICKMRVTITTYLRGRAVQVGERPALQNPPHQQTTQPGTGGTEGTASSPPLTASLILLRRKMLARALLPATAQMSSQLHPHRTTLRLFDKDEYCFLNKYKNSASSLASSF